ncbi:MAG: DOMON domain-containing protein, partial [Spirochaetales bacterium]|nr:DOMON domain-containing protein [Spirochaetales bacterium]
MKKTVIFTLLMIFLTLPLWANDRLEEDGFILDWKTEGNRLLITLSAETTGWIAFGIGATSVMKDANIILLWVDDNMGIAMGEDHFGTGRFAHKADMELGGSQDMQILSGRQTADTTRVSFSIPLDSGDEYDVPLIRGET